MAERTGWTWPGRLLLPTLAGPAALLIAISVGWPFGHTSSSSCAPICSYIKHDQRVTTVEAAIAVVIAEVVLFAAGSRWQRRTDLAVAIGVVAVGCAIFVPAAPAAIGYGAVAGAYGFQYPRIEDLDKPSRWRRVIAVTLGLTGIAVAIGFMILLWAVSNISA